MMIDIAVLEAADSGVVGDRVNHDLEAIVLLRNFGITYRYLHSANLGGADFALALVSRSKFRT